MNSSENGLAVIWINEYTYRMNTAILERPVEQIVSENIRIEAARRGFSQSALAREIKMSQPAISQRWRGVARWQLDELESLAHLFGVSVAYLVSDNAPSPSPKSLRPRQDSNLQPRDWDVYTGFANSDSECILNIAA